MKRCLLIVLDDDCNDRYIEELNPAYEITLRFDGGSWVAFCKPKDGNE